MKQLYTNTIGIAFLLLCTSTAGAHTTGTGSRLIAQSHYTSSGTTLVAYDSQRYVYPATTTLLYNQKLSFLFSTAWKQNQKFDYTYNTAGKLTNMQYQNWNAATSAFINGGLTFYTLNSAGFCVRDSNLLWLPATSAYRNNVLDIFTVNTAGQVTDQVYQNWDAGSNHLINYYHYANTYNAQGKPLTILLQEWDATIHWMDHTKSTYAYDGTGTKLQTITGQQDATTPGMLQTTYQDIYTLNADGTVASYLSKTYNAGTSTYTNSISGTMTYDAAGNNTLETQETWNAPTNAYKPYQQYVRTYNSNNQKTSETRMMWNGTAYTAPSSRDNYYYEPYTTAVGNAPAPVARLSVSPIPTTGVLHIALEWAEPQAFTASLTDMTGRLCHTLSEPAATQYAGNINIGNLPAGNYVLSIRGEQGSTTSRIIVLQH